MCITLSSVDRLHYFCSNKQVCVVDQWGRRLLAAAAYLQTAVPIPTGRCGSLLRERPFSLGAGVQRLRTGGRGYLWSIRGGARLPAQVR